MNKLVVAEVEIDFKTKENDCDKAFEELQAAMKNIGAEMVPTYKRILASVSNSNGIQVSYSAYPRDVEPDEYDPPFEDFADYVDDDEDISIAFGYGYDENIEGHDHKYDRKDGDDPNSLYITYANIAFETSANSYDYAIRELKNVLRSKGIELYFDMFFTISWRSDGSGTLVRRLRESDYSE